MGKFRNFVFLLIIFILFAGSSFGTIKFLEYRQAQQLINESNELNSKGKYVDAYNKLVKANSKWTPNSAKKEVEELKHLNKKLVVSTKNYEMGKELYYNDELEESIKILQKVEKVDINYESALNYISFAVDKIRVKTQNNDDGEVAGLGTTVSFPQVKEIDQAELIPTVSEVQIDTTALCSAKKQQMDGSIAQQANKSAAEAEVSAKSDPIFYQVWIGIVPNIERMINNWTVKTLGEYEAYCLTHNGDDSGWKLSSGPFDGINW